MGVSIDLPWPPTTNLIWRNFRGRTVMSKVGRQYRASVAAHIAEARVSGYGRRKLRVVLAAHMPDERRRDLDNLLKSVLDGLQASRVFEDDSQITDLRIYRAGLNRENPHITVWIEHA